MTTSENWSSQPPRSRFHPEPRRRLRLGARDLELLTFLADNHLASRSQIQRLFYGSKAYCNFRLRCLFDHQVVLRHFASITRSGNWGEEAVYTLGPAAVSPLVEGGQSEEDAQSLQSYVRRHRSPALISHSLHTIEIYLTFREALFGAPPHSLERWVGEVGARHEYQIQTPIGWKTEVFKPDGFLRIQDGKQPGRYHSFFIECDLGHTSQSAWKTKVATYDKYLRNGLFKSTYGEARFETLVVTRGQKRIEHLIEATTGEAERFFRFVSWTQFRENCLGAVWFSPVCASPTPLMPGDSQ